MQMTPQDQTLYNKKKYSWLRNWTLFSKLAPKIYVWSNVSLWWYFKKYGTQT